MIWLPSGLGWNVTTIFWLQTTCVEVAIFVAVVYLPRYILKLLKPYTDYADSMMTGENEADRELRRVRERSRAQ